MIDSDSLHLPWTLGESGYGAKPCSKITAYLWISNGIAGVEVG